MIKLQEVAKIYKPSRNVEVTALAKISLEIKRGEFVTILGKSGSGKSTLMYIIGLLEKPTMGKVFIQDQESSTLSDREISAIRNKTIGFVFQQFNLINKLTILENVLLPIAYSKNGITQKDQTFAHELLEKFGILEKERSFPNQLSGGQQQRVAIARALINRPEVIIADEPTGNLDSKTGVQIMDLIGKINSHEKKTIVLVTHDHNIAKYGHRVINLQDGVMI